LLAPLLVIAADAIPYGRAKLPSKYSSESLFSFVPKPPISRETTIEFADAYRDICPKVAGLIFSSGAELTISYPVFEGSLEAKEGKDRDSSLFVFANQACRYTVELKKFVSKRGVEIRSAPRSGNELKRGVEAELEMISMDAISAESASRAMLGCSRPRSCRKRPAWELSDYFPQYDVPAQAIFPVERIHRDNSRMMLLLTRFDSPETALEFWAGIYFRTNSLTVASSTRRAVRTPSVLRRAIRSLRAETSVERPTRSTSRTREPASLFR